MELIATIKIDTLQNNAVYFLSMKYLILPLHWFD